MEPVSFTAEEVEGMARRTLQQHCKKLSIKANGKNVEMKQRLIEYLEECEKQEGQSEEYEKQEAKSEDSIAEGGHTEAADSPALEGAADVLPSTETCPSTATEESIPADGPADDVLDAELGSSAPTGDLHTATEQPVAEPFPNTERDLLAEDVTMAPDLGDSHPEAASPEEFPLSCSAEVEARSAPVVEEEAAVEEDSVMEEAAHDIVEEKALAPEYSIMEEALDQGASFEQQEADVSSELDSTVTEDDIVSVASEPISQTQDCPRLSACADSTMDLEGGVATPKAAMVPVMWSPAVQRAVNDSGELCLSGEHRPFSLLESPMHSPIRTRPNAGSEDVQASPEAVPVHVMDLEIQAASPVLHSGMPACTPLQAVASRPKAKVIIRPTRQLTAPAIKLPSALAGLKETSSTLPASSKVEVPLKRKAPAQERQAGQKRKARDFDAIHDRQFSKLKSIADCVPSKPATKKRRMEPRAPGQKSDEGNVSGSAGPRTSSSKRPGSRGGMSSQGTSKDSTKRVKPLGDRKNTLSASRPAAVKRRNLSSSSSKNSSGKRIGSSASGRQSSSSSGKRSSSKLGSKPRMSIAERSMAAAKEKARKFGHTAKSGAALR